MLENLQDGGEIRFRVNEGSISNENQIINNDYESDKNKSEYFKDEELPLPNINSLRKWINNEKKAS